MRVEDAPEILAYLHKDGIGSLDAIHNAFKLINYAFEGNSWHTSAHAYQDRLLLVMVSALGSA